MNVSITVSIFDPSTNGPQTGFAATNMTLSYTRPGAADAANAGNDLAAVDSTHNDWGIKEIDATDAPGEYRIDLPDAAFATGVDQVTLIITDSTDNLISRSVIDLIDPEEAWTVEGEEWTVE